MEADKNGVESENVPASATSSASAAMLVLSEKDEYYDAAAIRQRFERLHPQVRILCVDGWAHGDCIVQTDERCAGVWRQVVSFVYGESV